MKRKALNGWLAVLLFVSVADTASSQPSSCSETGPEHQLVNAILSRTPLPDSILQDNAKTADYLIPSMSYYQALHTWYGGYQSKDKTAKVEGLDALRRAAKKLDGSLAERDEVDRDLALGLASGHLARALLEGEYYVEGYRQGTRARERLLRFLEKAPEDHPGRADAGFLAGLYEVYTHDLQNRFHWLLGTIKYRGNRERGIRLIEQAVSGNAVFATEALRALLAEVSWRMPDFCRYTDLLESTARQYARNTDLAVLSQGLLLRCGLSHRARALNEWLSKDETEFPDNAVLDRARLRILADLGHVETMRQHGDKQNDVHYRLYLAYAQDVSGKRQEATRTYRELAQSAGPKDPVRRVSEVRLRYPYQPPPRIAIEQFQPAPCGG